MSSGTIGDFMIGFFRGLTTTVDADTAGVTYELGGFGNPTAFDPTADASGGSHDAFGPLGLIARFLPPDDDGHAECYGVRIGDRVLMLGWRDHRLTRLFPNGVAEGDVVLCGYGNDFVRIARDGSVSIATTDDGTPTGRMIHAQVRRDGFEWVGPWGRMRHDDTGFHVQHRSGARIDLGGIGGAPPPLDALGSYVTISAAMLKLEASILALGTDAGVPTAAARADATAVALGAVATALTAVATAFGTFVTTFPGASQSGAVTGASAITAAVLSLNTAIALIPSSSTTVT